MTAFIDAAVLMYAAGSDHPFREPCARVLRRVQDGSIDATTSIEVVQEILHRYLASSRPDGGITLVERTLDLFAPVLPITHFTMRRVPDLAKRYPTLQSRDLLHLATCIHEGIAEIVTTDKAFDLVVEVKRIDPVAFIA